MTQPQQQSSPTPSTGSRGSSRISRRLLRFEDVELTQPQPGSVSCRVTLVDHSDRVIIGEGTSVVLGAARMTAAARAAVHAVQAYAEVQFTLESCNKTHVAGRDLVLVVVGSAAEPALDLAGAVIVRGDDESRAAALAVLDATNRWLETRAKHLPQ